MNATTVRGNGTVRGIPITTPNPAGAGAPVINMDAVRGA